eukprot:TRINITY_DN1595_c0_g4_i3.p1 TRINITY_DN1595_c0_g4~~TRINITY_DN1595_c0_g4_i3.p1  ORF type:complete len:473 (-),score=108.63 TRINITY_DN1595_c0_g4_i3:319-1737(-)
MTEVSACDVLNQKDLVLEDLLIANDYMDELRRRKAPLLQILSTQENVCQLLKFALDNSKEGHSESSEDRQLFSRKYRIAHAATKTLTEGVSQIDTMLVSPTPIQQLLRFFENPDSCDETTSSNFLKIINHVTKYDRVAVIDATAMIPDLCAKILRFHEEQCVWDALCNLLGNDYSGKIVNALGRKEFISEIVRLCLSSEKTKEVEVFSSFLCNLHQMAYRNVPLSEIICVMYENDYTVSFLSSGLKSATTIKPLLEVVRDSLKLLAELKLLKRIPLEIQTQTIEKMVPTICKAVPILKDEKCLVYGEYSSNIGRVQIMEIAAHLVHAWPANCAQAFEEAKFLEFSLGMIHLFPRNNILHCSILEVVDKILTSSETSLASVLLCNSKLPEFIRTYLPTTDEEIIEGLYRPSYAGHLAQMAKMIQESQHAAIATEADSEWDDFYLTIVAPKLEREVIPDIDIEDTPERASSSPK